MQIQFTIPGKPTAWQRARQFVHKQTGRIVKANPPEMMEQQRVIQLLCRSAMRTTPPMTGPLKLELLCVYPIPPSWPKWKQDAALAGLLWKTSTPDHDNLIKQVSDALNGIAYVDDAQIVRTVMGKRYGRPARTEVRIAQLDALSDHSPRATAEAMLAARRGQDSLDLPPVNPCNTVKRGGA